MLKALKLSFPEGLRRNVFGIDARQTPDLDEERIRTFLADIRPVGEVRLRHTIGMLDALEGEGSLAEEIAHARLLLFKIKIGGDVDADIARLQAIHALLSLQVPDYRATLDANEQYDPERLRLLLQAMQSGGLQAFRERLLYIEQPFDRAGTFAAPLGDLAAEIPFIIDEADGDYDAFPRAVELGYRGVSSKACKGFYKSILNGVRAAAFNERQPGRFFVSAEDLTCQAGLGIEQDTALVATLGAHPCRAQRASLRRWLRPRTGCGSGALRRCASRSLPEAGRPHRPCFRTRFSADRFPVVCPRFRRRCRA